MCQKVTINDYPINVDNLYEEIVTKKVGNKRLRKISFDFKVSNTDYHEITTLLYANDFTVEIPEKNIGFQATIHSYATSVTNLYEEGAVGDFKLALIEKV